MARSPQQGFASTLQAPNQEGVTTVKHPAKDFPIGTLKSTERQSGVKLT